MNTLLMFPQYFAILIHFVQTSIKCTNIQVEYFLSDLKVKVLCLSIDLAPSLIHYDTMQVRYF